MAKIFQEDFKCHPDDMFDDFERVSVASASVAQVHRAKLKDGTPVAVKVQKPNIKKQMVKINLLLGSLSLIIRILLFTIIIYY